MTRGVQRVHVWKHHSHEPAHHQATVFDELKRQRVEGDVARTKCDADHHRVRIANQPIRDL